MAKKVEDERVLNEIKGMTIESRLELLEKRLLERLEFLEEKIKEMEEKKRREEELSLPEFFSRYQEKFDEALSKLERVRKRSSLPRLFDFGKAIENLKKVFKVQTYINLWRSISMWITSDVVDEFGLDPVFEEKITPFFEFLYHKWWRVSVIGLNNLPNKGRVLLVANHAGTLPFDGAMIKYAAKIEHPAHREIRPLVENFVYYFPFLGTFMMRIGGVRADPDNARRLLEKEQAVLVFPEGVKGVGKLYKQRYRLQRFGRGGFIKLALRTRSPILPVAVVGSEEIYPMIARLEGLGRFFGVPYIPITLTFPWLGPIGLIPLPSKWYIHFGELIDISQYPPEAVNDEILVNHLSEMVRKTIQEMLYELLKKRRSIWFG
jgi:1-acyl-sn-glycerol-3-phosphate acyltransferase